MPEIPSTLPSTDLINQHGFATYVAVALLVSCITLLFFFARWFAQAQANSLQIHSVAIEQLVTSNEKLVKSNKLLLIASANLQSQLLAHDLTMSGLNPSTEVDFQERDSKAYMKYQEVEKRLADLRLEIKEQI